VTPAARARLAWTVGLLVVTIGIVVAVRSVDWRAALSTIAHVRIGWLVLAVVLNAGILVAWGGFWSVLAPRAARVPYRRMFEIAAIASAVMNTVPFLAGHATGVALLIKRAGLSAQSALSVLALDQLGEGIVKVAVCLAVGLFSPLPGWMHRAFIGVTIVVGLLLVLLLFVANSSERWGRDLAALRDVRHGIVALVLVAMSKVMEALGIVAVQHAFGLGFALPAVLLVLAAVLLATMIPVSPGNLGAYEAAAFFVYRYLGLSPEQALALAIVQHLCFMAPSIGVGYALGARRAIRG